MTGHDYRNPCERCRYFSPTDCLLGVSEWFGMLCGHYLPKGASVDRKQKWMPGDRPNDYKLFDGPIKAWLFYLRRTMTGQRTSLPVKIASVKRQSWIVEYHA